MKHHCFHQVYTCIKKVFFITYLTLLVMERTIERSGALNIGINWGSQITYPTTQYLAVPPGVGTANMTPSSLIKLNVVSSTWGTFVSISGIRGGGGFCKQHGNET